MGLTFRGTVETVTKGERTPGDLAALAAAYGVETCYTDWRGRPARVPVTTITAVLAALGADASSPEAIRAELGRLDHERRTRLLPPVVVAYAGESLTAARTQNQPGTTDEYPNGACRSPARTAVPSSSTTFPATLGPPPRSHPCAPRRPAEPVRRPAEPVRRRGPWPVASADAGQGPGYHRYRCRTVMMWSATSRSRVSGAIGRPATAENSSGSPGSAYAVAGSTTARPSGWLPSDARVRAHASSTSSGLGTPKPCPTGAACRSPPRP